MSERPAFPRLTRREALRIFGAYAGMSILAACTPIGSPASGPTSAPASQKTGEAPKAGATPAVLQPRSGGTLRYGTDLDLTTLDMHLVQPQTGLMISPVYNLLTWYDDQLRPQPELAESWDLSSDARQMKLTLRKGVLYHTGREFTAEDVKYNILRVRDPKIGVAQLAAQSKWITDIQIPDKYTLVFKFDAPRPAIFDFFNSFYMVDKDTMEGPDAKNKAVGTGPFKFVEWIPGDHVRLVKNKDYWKNGLPYLDEIVYPIIKDEQAMVVQLESGALDAANPVYEREAARLMKDSKYLVHINKTGGGVYYIGANVTVPPTDNKKFRQALNYAIDRKRFVDTAMQGLGQPQSLPWPQYSPAFEQAKTDLYSFNLDKAAALVKESGITNPELEYIYISSNESAGALGQILQSDLAKIGVKLSVKGLEPLRWREQSESFKYQLNASSSSAANLDPSSMFSLSRPWSPTSNNCGFKSDKYTQLANDMAIEADPLKRKKLYADMNDLILDESFMMPISPQTVGTPMRTNVHWQTNRLGGGLLLETAWLG